MRRPPCFSDAPAVESQSTSLTVLSVVGVRAVFPPVVLAAAGKEMTLGMLIEIRHYRMVNTQVGSL